MSPDEWDGVNKLLFSAGQYVDLKGATISKTTIDLAAGLIAGLGNYGTPSHLFMPIRQQTGLDTSLEGSLDRVIFAAADLNGSPVENAGWSGGQSRLAGSPVAGFRSSFGTIKFSANNFTAFRPTVFINPQTNTEASTNQLMASSVPTNLAITATTSASYNGFSGSGVGGAQTGGGIGGGYNGAYAGVYSYRVSAACSSGESICCSAANGTVAANGRLALVWDSMPNAQYYNVYRSRCGGGATDVTYITRVAATGNGAGGEGYIDYNLRIAGCDDIVMMDLAGAGESAAFGWADLAPLTKYDLPMLDTVYQFMLFKYGAFVPYNIKKAYLLRNVGANV
jgi:hypothetical protein